MSNASIVCLKSGNFMPRREIQRNVGEKNESRGWPITLMEAFATDWRRAFFPAPVTVRSAYLSHFSLSLTLSLQSTEIINRIFLQRKLSRALPGLEPVIFGQNRTVRRKERKRGRERAFIISFSPGTRHFFFSPAIFLSLSSSRSFHRFSELLFPLPTGRPRNFSPLRLSCFAIDKKLTVMRIRNEIFRMYVYV